MIANLKRRFIALPTWARYALATLCMSIATCVFVFAFPLIVIGTLVHMAHEIIVGICKE